MPSFLNTLADLPGRIYPTVWRLPNVLKIYEYKALVQQVNWAGGQRVLDLGCGQGLQAQLIALRGPHVLGIDPVERFIRSANYKKKWSLASSRLEFLVGMVENMTLPAASFDAIVSFCVLEHIPNLAQVLSTLHALLKPGGQIHATVDALAGIEDEAILAHHREKFKVCQYFRPDSLKDTLESAGFQVKSQRYILTSPMAHSEFLDDLNDLAPRLSTCEKMRRYRQLASQEAQSTTRPGIMILFHAGKR